MPYDKFTRDGKICVFRTENEQPIGDSLGCHETEEEANRQIAALYANEEKDMKKVALPEEMKDKSIPEWFGGTSFDEFERLEEMEEIAEHVMKGALLVPSIVENIIWRDELSESKMKEIADGFIRFVSKVFKSESEPNLKSKSGFLVVKDVDSDTYLWFSRYSNNIKDRDNPPDIISTKSHARFVKMVDEEIFPYPDLWLWHESNLVLGKCTWLDFDEENGVAMAAGVFYPYANHIAKAIQESETPWTVSHGMPSMSIVRDPSNPGVIIEHQTIEISPVPFEKAANIWADFATIKELDMAMNEAKRAQLKQFLPITDADLDEIESRNKAISIVAEELNLERKDIDEDESTIEPIVDSESEEVPIEPTEPIVESGFTDEQRKELAGLFDVAFKQFFETLDEHFATPPVEKSVEEDNTFDLLTAAGLQEKVVGNLKSLSAIASKETKVDGRTKEGKSMPEENEDKEIPRITGNALLNSVIGNLINAPQGE